MNRDAIHYETDKVSVWFRKMLVPTFLGMLFMSAVTAIDGIFIGHGVGADGVAAVNIVVPIYLIMSGLGLMIGAGCSVVASIQLSRQKIRIANINITQALVFSSVVTILFTILVMLFPSQTAVLLGTSKTLMPQVIDYLQWIMPCFTFEMWSLIGLFIIRLDGSPRYAMWCNILPSALNVLLDWIFIFPLDMGVKGASIATSISITVGGIMALGYLLFATRTFRLVSLKLSTKSLRLLFRNIGYHCKIGSSSLLGELTLAVFIFMGNVVFMHYLGDAGVGAFGIACYYAPFFFSMGNAIAQSAQPIVSYHYGVKQWQQVYQAKRLLLYTSVVVGVAVTLLFVFMPEWLVSLFVDAQSKAGGIAIVGFPYFATGIIFFILNVAMIGYYQSIEQIKKATLLVGLRGFILLIPCFILLPQLVGVNGIWLSMPLTEALTALVMLVLTCLNRES